MTADKPKGGATLSDVARTFVRKLVSTSAEHDPEKERAFLESEETREREVVRKLRELRERREATVQARPLFAIQPGVGIGPFRLGMTEEEIDTLCLQFDLRNEGSFKSSLRIGFHEGRAVQIEMAADMELSLGDEPVNGGNNERVKQLLAKIAPPGPDWTEMEGLVVFHWESRSEPVFSFMVYAPGYRFLPELPSQWARREWAAQGCLTKEATTANAQARCSCFVPIHPW